MFQYDFYWDRFEVFHETHHQSKKYKMTSLDEVYRNIDYLINQLQPKMLY